MKPLFYLTLLTVCLTPFCAVWSKNNVAAKALSAHLKPLGLTPKPDPDGLSKVRGQIVSILTDMENSEVNAGPGAQELLNTAYELFRPEVGPAHRTAATAALVAMWSEARALGAFDKEGKFTGAITKGADAGNQVVFEYIVTTDIAPEFSRDVANVRMVPPSKARATGAPLTARESAYRSSLDSIKRESAGIKSLAKIENAPKTNAVGQTLQDAQKIWQASMAQHGEKAKELPSIVLLGKIASTPSKRNNYRWVAQADVTNLSLHPTEVELEGIFIGSTDKLRKNYVMGVSTLKLQMRAGEAMKVPLQTPLSEQDYKRRTDDFETLDKKERALSKANYRGLILRVKHAKGEAATFATDPSLLGLLEKDSKTPLDSLPKLYLDPKQ